MRRCSALWVVIVVWQITSPPSWAWAQDDDSLPCDVFYKNPDGSWTATQAVSLGRTGLVSRAGGTFRPGVAIRGYDVAAELDRACPNPATSPSPPPQVQQPRVSLSSFADANGTIDITRLTCGHLADTSDGEADLLLAWYGGAPPGTAAKRRLFNMARLQTAIHNVVAYCRSHRDQNLVRVMDDLMSK